VSDSPTPDHAATKRRYSRIATVAVLVLVFPCMLGLLPWPTYDIVAVLATGWLKFVSRTLPRISWNADLIVTAVLCCVVILGLAHGFLRWITKSIASARGKNWTWPWKWTWCGLLGIFVLFLIGMSVGGAVHQVGWMASTQESWFERKSGSSSINDMRQLDSAFQQAMLEFTNNLAEVRRQLKNPDNGYIRRYSGEPPMFQRYNFLLIMDDNNGFAGEIIFPRNYSRNPHAQLMYLFDSSLFLPIDKLPELIKKHQEHLLAL
jgi:hypothetical protein